MIKYNVIVSQEATDMLTKHAAFMAAVSVNAARQLALDFERAAHSLENMPFRCPVLYDDAMAFSRYRYLVFSDRYAIIFQVKEDIVYLDYVVDMRQDYSWLFEG